MTCVHCVSLVFYNNSLFFYFLVISTNQSLDLEPKESTVFYTTIVFDNVVVREMYVSWECAIAKQGTMFHLSHMIYFWV